jgi:hypothetical protein
MTTMVLGVKPADPRVGPPDYSLDPPQLLYFLQERHPGSLPKVRADLRRSAPLHEAPAQ